MSWSPEQFKKFLAVLDEEGIEHTTSASSLKTFKMCRRKWWMEKIRKLSTPIKQFGVIGTVLHSICERYLLADDQGYDDNGKPVELYPNDWEIAYNTYPTHVETCRGHKDHDQYDKYVECDCPHEIDGVLSPEEQAMVRKLVSEGIDAGVLERHAGREVEKKIFFEALVNANGKINVVGFIDCLEPDMIQDHKTTGRMKYALSKNKLDKDLQMNVYGYEAFVLNPPEGTPDKVWFRHNVYCKDPKDMRVKKTEVERSLTKIKNYYEKEVYPCFEEMLLLIKNTRNWSDIEPPQDISGACNAYGGCPFLSICAGSESLEMYVKRIDRCSNPDEKKTASKPVTGKGKRVSLLDKSKKKTTPAAKKPEAKKDEKKAKPNKLKVKTTPSKDKKPKPEAKPENVAVGGSAPWYVEGCKACSTNTNPGIGSNGKPCLICVTKNEDDIKVTDYKEIADDDGNLCWIEKESGEVVSTDSTIADKEVAAEEAVASEEQVDEADEKKKASDEKKAAKKAEQEEAARQKREAANEKSADKSGKELGGEVEGGLGLDPKSSTNRRKFILILGGTSVDGTMSSGAAIGTAGRLVTIGELMVILGESLGEIYKDKMDRDEPVNFYDIDAFERRDMLCANVESIMDLLGNSALACPCGMTADEKSVVAALRPYAARVFSFSP